eukprot:SAG11_NODE_2629_length_3159_cov_1.468954_1_plen_56_part_00
MADKSITLCDSGTSRYTSTVYTSRCTQYACEELVLVGSTGGAGTGIYSYSVLNRC